jgi:hypothetical protein
MYPVLDELEHGARKFCGRWKQGDASSLCAMITEIMDRAELKEDLELPLGVESGLIMVVQETVARPTSWRT